MWVSKSVDECGNGDYVLSKEAADAWASSMDKKYPDITHWVDMKIPNPLNLKGHRCSYGDLSFVPHESSDESP